MNGGLDKTKVIDHPPDVVPVVDVNNSFVFPGHALHTQWVIKDLAASLTRQVKKQIITTKQIDLSETP